MGINNRDISDASPILTRSGNNQAYYIFNAGNGQGFVVVSGDDATAQVLGYADKGDFDYEKAPDNMKAWLYEYSQEINYLQKHPSNTSHTLHRTNNKSSISPLLTSEWDQDEPFNNSCPDFFSYGKCVTGCVATAMAQLMYNHRANSVKATTATIPAYKCRTNWSGYGQISVSKIPAGTMLDWNNMTDTYSSSSSDASKAAVANLIFYCGASVQMDYKNSANGGSGAQSNSIPIALKKYFGYQSSTDIIIRDNYTMDDWNQTIYDEISANRPVIYSGTASSGSGHEFIIDGYESSTNTYHVNWGWGGYCDGYFKLSVLDPAEGGIGSGTIGDGYQFNQTAIINAEPGSNNIASNHPLTAKDLTISGNTISYYPYNDSGEKETFYYGIGIRNDDGSYTPLATASTPLTLDAGQYISNPIKSFQVTLPSSTSEAKLVPISHTSGNNEWVSCWSKSKYILAQADASGNVTLTMMPQYTITVENVKTGNLLVSNHNIPVSFDLVNSGSNGFYGTLYYFSQKDGGSKEKVKDNLVEVDANSRASQTVGFVPTEAGTYTFYICYDASGNEVLGSTTFEVTEGQSPSTQAASIVSINVENADFENEALDDDKTSTVIPLKTMNLKGDCQIKLNQDLTGTDIIIYLYQYDETSKKYGNKKYPARYITVTGSAGTSFSLQFNFSGLTDGKYMLSIQGGTVDSNHDIKSPIFNLNEYRFLVGTATGIEECIQPVSDAPVVIYNLQGVKVAETTATRVSEVLHQQPKGIYIVGGRKVVNR